MHDVEEKSMEEGVEDDEGTAKGRGGKRVSGVKLSAQLALGANGPRQARRNRKRLRHKRFGHGAGG